MNDSQNDSKHSNESSNESTSARAERAVSKSNISLAEQRRSGRTLGFLGLSTVGHVAILVALASVPMAIHEMNSGDNKPAGGGEVSMVDTSGDSAAIAAGAMAHANNDSTVEVSVMTDESSDVVMSPKAKTESKPESKVEAAVTPLPEKKAPEPKVEAVKPLPEKILPEKKVVAKAPTKATAKIAATKDAPATEEVASSPMITEETQDAPPVLLANPPSDDEQETETAQAVAPQVEEPVKEEVKPEPKKVVAVSPAPKKAEPKPAPKVEPVAQPQEDPAEEVEAVAPVAEKKSETAVAAKSASKAAKESDANESSEGTAAVASSAGHSNDSSENASSAVAAKSNGDQTGQGGQGQGGTVGGVAGPIRDASELKALSGNPNPVYPARDRLAHKEGTAVILGRVSPDGRIVETTLEKSSGSANMDAASMQAFRGWRFQAGQQGWVRKPFQFRLVGEAKEVPAPLGKGLTR